MIIVIAEFTQNLLYEIYIIFGRLAHDSEVESDDPTIKLQSKIMDVRRNVKGGMVGLRKRKVRENIWPCLQFAIQ